MTGHDDSAAIAQLYGICGAMQKPISPDLIVKVVENIVGEAYKSDATKNF
jgi:hypothetical protein